MQQADRGGGQRLLTVLGQALQLLVGVRQGDAAPLSQEALANPGRILCRRRDRLNRGMLSHRCSDAPPEGSRGKEDGRMVPQPFTVGIMAEPGLPAAIAERIAADLSEQLAQETGSSWDVDVRRTTLPLTPEGGVGFRARADELLERYGWAYVVYLTDLPRQQEGHPLVAEVSLKNRAALVSLSALGATRQRSRTRELVATLARTTEDTPGLLRPARIAQAVDARKVRCVPSPDREDMVHVLLTGRSHRARMLGGMVRNNRPGRMLRALTRSIAVAAATGAFGIFYSSIWNLSDALPAPRLLAISFLVTAVLTGWLIVRSGLWNRGRNEDEPGSAWLDNVATVVTVGLSAALMYALLFTGLLCLALVVVDAGYLGNELGKPAVIGDYVDLAWLSTSFGMLGGSLGSSFDSDEAIREATYSRRWHERRKLFDSYENNDDRE